MLVFSLYNFMSLCSFSFIKILDIAVYSLDTREKIRPQIRIKFYQKTKEINDNERNFISTTFKYIYTPL